MISNILQSFSQKIQLFQMLTIHGTFLGFQTGTQNFVHGSDAQFFDESYLICLADQASFIVREIASDIHQGVSDWQLVPMAMTASFDEKKAFVTLKHPITGHFYCAEPIQADQPFLPVIANRSTTGLWENFSISEINIPEGISGASFVFELTSLIKNKPDLAWLLSRIQSETNEYSTNSITAYVFTHIHQQDITRFSLSKFEAALRKIADPADVWLWLGIPSLSRWEADRALPSAQLTIGPELDCIADGYQGQATFGRLWCSARRRNVVPRRRTCIIASARNEGPYLIEWIAYHRAIGIEHIFVYSNNNDDNSDALLEKLSSSGVITWIDNVLGPSGLPQQKCYGHALGIYPDVLDYEWALIIDIDEFFVFDTSKYRNIHDYINWQEQQDVDAISLNWCWYGTYGIRRFSTDQLLTRRFIERRSDIDKHGKSLFRPRKFDRSHCHYPFPMPGVEAKFRNSDRQPYRHEAEFAASLDKIANNAWINHYFSKSIDDMLWKSSRNEGDKLTTTLNNPLKVAYAVASRIIGPEMGVSTVTDARIISCVPNLEKEIEILLALTGVRAAAHNVNEIVRSRINDIRSTIAAFDPYTTAPELHAVIDLMRDA